jgi:hypothetical protein
METKYYLPISSRCLAHYFGSACIMPSKYFQNKPMDLQNKFEEFLLLTTNIGTKETDCSLELVLTQSELKDLIDIKRGFYLYQKPLPISRVKSVLFSDKNQKEQTIVNITMSTAFIPENIIEIVENFDTVDTSKLKVPSKLHFKNWSLEIRKFNSVLGGFALMRLAGEEYMNYSENYFSTLSFFNETIKNELIVAGKNIDNRFWDAFIGNSTFKKIYPILNKSVDEYDLDEIAKSEGQTIEKDKITRIIDLDKIEKTTTYTVAVLNTFGVGNEARKKKIDGLILSNFKSEIKRDKSEGIALCFGLNRGYSVFSNKYKSGNIEKNVKFKLDSQLDYYTIESLYQFIFNETKSEGFPYLDSWCPKSKEAFKTKTDYQILDVVVKGLVYKKPKVSSQEYLTNLLQRFFQKGSESLFKDLFEKIRTTIYFDTYEELKDEITLKNEEIRRLNNDSFNANNKLRSEINRLMTEIDFLNNKKKQEVVLHKSKNNFNSAEDTTLNFDKKLLIKQVLAYSDKKYTKAILEKEAKEKGISIPKGVNRDEIIFILITTSNTSIDSKLQFPE